MSAVMKASEFVKKLEDVAKNYKTLYVMGCFGAPMNSKNKTRYCNNHSYNKQAARTKYIQAATADTFGFDCVCLLKGILWGWNGDKSKTYGGAVYKANGVPDIGADQMIKVCSDISTDFSNIEVGEAVWMSGHIGVYIGDGLAVECTPRWKNCVQITACNCSKSGYNTRNWTKHGKLPYIDYDVKSTVSSNPVTTTPAVSTTTAEKTIWDFLMNKIGNPYGVAGLMGNLYAESALQSNNLQNTYEKKLGYTDVSYTAAVDNGSYTNFIRDSAGYGLAQWTYWSRKENLLKYAQSEKKSIGDLTMQLEFLYKELSESYKSVLNTLKNAKNIRTASDAVLTKFERPANQSESVQVKRTTYGQKYYDKYASTDTVSTETVKPALSTTTKVDYAQKFDKSIAGSYEVTASSGLHIRSGANTKKTSLGVLPGGTVVKNYGYYNVAANGIRWLYVKTPSGLVGFCSSTYLKKK
jgi:N-acetylmuramoyl-L-alanine amidase